MYESWEDAIILLPDHMRAGVTRYIEEGIEGGGFQQAVFANDFLRTCQAADFVNKAVLRYWGEFLTYCPPQCYGSYEKVKAWIQRKGLEGIKKEQTDG
jgi:hypothetical protein